MAIPKTVTAAKAWVRRRKAGRPKAEERAAAVKLLGGKRKYDAYVAEVRGKKTPAKKKKKATKKKTKRKTTKKKASKKKKTVKKSKTTRRGRSTTRSRKGISIMGKRGWLALWYFGPSKGGRGSDKTWAVKVERKAGKARVVTRWGRRTGQKNETAHSWTTLAKANAKADRLILSKLRKGYGLAGANRKKRHRTRR